MVKDKKQVSEEKNRRVSFNGQISGLYDSQEIAQKVKKELEESFPDAKVELI